MADICAGMFVGLTEVGIGHPMKTIAVRIQNNLPWARLPVATYYRGAVQFLQKYLFVPSIAMARLHLEQYS